MLGTKAPEDYSVFHDLLFGRKRLSLCPFCPTCVSSKSLSFYRRLSSFCPVQLSHQRLWPPLLLALSLSFASSSIQFVQILWNTSVSVVYCPSHVEVRAHVTLPLSAVSRGFILSSCLLFRYILIMVRPSWMHDSAATYQPTCKFSLSLSLSLSRSLSLVLSRSLSLSFSCCEWRHRLKA